MDDNITNVYGQSWLNIFIVFVECNSWAHSGRTAREAKGRSKICFDCVRYQKELWAPTKPNIGNLGCSKMFAMYRGAAFEKSSLHRWLSPSMGDSKNMREKICKSDDCLLIIIPFSYQHSSALSLFLEIFPPVFCAHPYYDAGHLFPQVRGASSGRPGPYLLIEIGSLKS